LTSPSLPASPAPMPGSASGAISVSGPATPPIAVSISASDVRPQVAPFAVSDSDHKPGVQRIPQWLRMTLIFALIELEILVGAVLCIAPWTVMLWDRNYLFVQYPTLSIYAANGAVRGIVSGLGLLNLWIAFHDAFKHRDGK